MGGDKAGEHQRTGLVACIGEGGIVGCQHCGAQWGAGDRADNAGNVQVLRVPRGGNPLLHNVPWPGIDPIGRWLATGQQGVGGDHRAEALGHLGQQRQANGTAPILTDQHCAVDVQRAQQLTDLCHMAGVTVVAARRGFVGAAKADQVWRYAAHAAGAERVDHVPVEKAPAGLAVQHEHDAPVVRADIQIVHAQLPVRFVSDHLVVRCPGEIRQVGEMMVGRAQYGCHG